MKVSKRIAKGGNENQFKIACLLFLWKVRKPQGQEGEYRSILYSEVGFQKKQFRVLNIAVLSKISNIAVTFLLLLMYYSCYFSSQA